MTQVEFQAWVKFYTLHPFDDLHRFHRPAAMVGSSLSGKLQEKLDWLCPPVFNGEYGQADMNTIKAFGFKGPGG